MFQITDIHVMKLEQNNNKKKTSSNMIKITAVNYCNCKHIIYMTECILEAVLFLIR